MKKFFVRCFVRWCEVARNSFAPRFLYPSKAPWIIAYVMAVVFVISLVGHFRFAELNLSFVGFCVFVITYSLFMGNALLLRWIYLKHCFPCGVKATYQKIVPEDVNKEE